MKHLIEFGLEDGSTILVEVEETDGAGVVPAGRGGKVVQRARQSFEAALDKLRPAAQALIGKLRSLHDPPDEIEIEFGLKMNAEAGVLIAAGNAEANYKVTLTWKRSAS